ncbi:MAG: 4Fe-4S dicluster domain-containing protein [Anaerolineales bacterium]|nr:4Fe-4S dicluster domain-containing protein [Anaerolineales bacterium]
MLQLPGLARILERFEAAPVSLAPEWCLRRRHKGGACRRCLETCPTQAITEDDPIALDVERCVGCGLCLHLCPTEVFGTGGGAEAKLLAVLAPLAGTAVELACERKEPLAETRANAEHIVALKGCLGSLSLPLLLSAVAQGIKTLWLYDEVCADCPLGSVQASMERTVGMANRLLTIFGQKRRVLTYRGSPELLAAKGLKRPVAQSDQPRYSRRDFFASLRRSAQGALAETIASSLSTLEETSSLAEEKVPQRVPLARRRLARVLPQLGPPAVNRFAANGLPFANVAINDDCLACGLCGRFCPTGALTFASDEEQFAITFTAVNCLDCEICSLICPAQAVVFDQEIETIHLVESAPRVLLVGQLASCQGCGAPCAATDAEPLCFVCRKRREHGILT